MLGDSMVQNCFEEGFSRFEAEVLAFEWLGGGTKPHNGAM